MRRVSDLNSLSENLRKLILHGSLNFGLPIFYDFLWFDIIHHGYLQLQGEDNQWDYVFIYGDILSLKFIFLICVYLCEHD